MKGILNVFKNDINKIFQHKIAIIIMIGTLIIPGIYAWINIDSNWNPYENTSNLPIAIVNNDKGVTILEKYINMGDLMEDSLKENNAMNWIFTDEDIAKANVEKSIYYGLIIIPENFSQKCITLFDGNKLEKPSFDFYINQKKNPVAPIIVDKAVSTIQTTLNQNFVNSIIYKIVDTAEGIDIINKTMKSSDDLIEKLSDTKMDVSKLRAIIKTMDIASDSTVKSLSAIRDLLPTVSSITGTSKQGIADIKNAVNNFSNNYKNTSNNISSTFSSIKDVEKDINSTLTNANISYVKENLNLLLNTLDDIKNNLLENKNALFEIENSSRIFEISDIQNEINSTINSINDLQKIISNTNNSISNIEKITDNLSYINTSKVQENLDIIYNKLNEIERKLNNIKNIFSQLNLPILNNLQNEIDNMINEINNLKTIVNNTKDSLKDLDKLGSTISNIDFSNTKDNLIIISNNLNVMENKLNNLQNLLSNTNDSANLLQVDKFQERIDKILKQIDDLQDVIKRGNETLDNLEDIQSKMIDLNNQINDIELTYDNTIKSDLDSAYSNASKAMSDITNVISSLDSGLDRTDSAMSNMISALTNTRDLTGNIDFILAGLQNDIDRIIKSVENEMQSDLYTKIANVLQNDPNVIADYLTTLVETNEIDLYNIDSYGSKMAPFYTILACWVGCTILVSLFKTDIKESENTKIFKNYQIFFGRFMLFGIFAILQGLIIGLGDIILQVQVINYPLFLFTIMLSSFVFMLIVYSLTVSFGKVGQATSIVFLVLQVAGSGGTFPIELLPRHFQVLQPFMPFFPAMNALRETIGGFYGNYYATYVFQLCCHIIIPLLLGLSFRKRIMHVKEKIDDDLKKTDLII